MRVAQKHPFKHWSVGVAVAAALAALVVACGHDDGDQSIEVTNGIALQNATVVDTRDGSLSQGVTVVVVGDRIQTVTANKVRVSGAAQSVDVSGKFIVPGFLDMHTHLLDSPASELSTVEQLFVANGITGIREMRGAPDLIQSARQINADRAADRIVSPEILIISGATIGLNAPPAAALTADAATQEVQAQKVYGAGFIKTINATRDATFAFLAEAKRQGLYVAGHLNPSVSAVESSNAGWHAIEHLGSGMGTLLDCSTQEATIRATVLSGQGVVPAPNPPSWSANALNAPLYQRVHDTYDNAKCVGVAQTFARNDTWHAPTLFRLRTQRFVEDGLYRNDPNLKYVSRATRASWEAAAVRQTTTLSPAAIAVYHQYFDRELVLPMLLKQNSVGLLAGSDTSVIANWVIPGFSLHQEFALLSAGGFSPLDVLQMTTLNGARFLGREATMGTVEQGKNADLVLLDANPMADVANLDKIAAVVVKGRYLPRAALDKLLSDAAATYAAPAAQAVTTELLPDHAD